MGIISFRVFPWIPWPKYLSSSIHSVQGTGIIVPPRLPVPVAGAIQVP
jgi:hypothetical protein